MNDRLENIKKELEIMEGKEIKIGYYTKKFEDDLKWLIEKAEKTKVIKENANGRPTVIEYNGLRYILDKDHLKRQAKDLKKYYEG